MQVAVIPSDRFPVADRAAHCTYSEYGNRVGQERVMALLLRLTGYVEVTCWKSYCLLALSPRCQTGVWWETPLFVIFIEDEASVGATKSEGVGHDTLHIHTVLTLRKDR